MAAESGRDDFIIAIRSAFLKKGTRQNFSLFTLLIISILVLSLEYFKSGPINKFRSITKDLIFKGSFLVSAPFVYVKDQYYLLQDHLNMYDEFQILRVKNFEIEKIKNEIEFYKSENTRLKKLIDQYPKLDYKDFKRIKFDKQFPNPFNYSWMNIDSLFLMRPSDYPSVKNILKSIQSWDRVASADSYGAGSYAVLYSKLRKYYNKLPDPKIFTTSVLNEALIEALQHMEKYFGTTKIKLGSFQKLVRGDKELSIFGLPDIISSMGSAPYKEGMRKVVSGESYIELVKFTPKGVEIESIISYGSSDHPKSKHFNDKSSNCHFNFAIPNL